MGVPPLSAGRHPPPPLPPRCSPQPFIPAFHLSPGDGALVAVTTPQSVPARCHGTQRCSEPNPRTPAAPPRVLPHSQPPLLHPRGALCQAWGLPSAHPGGWQGRGGGRCPCPRYPPRCPRPSSCAMAIGEVRPCKLCCPGPFPLSSLVAPRAMALRSLSAGGVGEQPPNSWDPPRSIISAPRPGTPACSPGTGVPLCPPPWSPALLWLLPPPL